ncbi:amidohydrolase family protein [Streptomyces sp. NPDC047022]|uniref:amidohydrolase family protein n=1 Tax=Streptomyces sp. NPDC047022 TaxID=3155737 RepID=UPI0033CFFB49
MSRETILDFHARLAPRPGALDLLLADMKRAGVQRAAVAAGGVIDLDVLAGQVVEGGHSEADPDNDLVLDACARSDGQLIPFFFANPHRPVGHYRGRAAEFRALELSPAVHGVGLDDPRTTRLVEVAAEFGHPVYTVCLTRPGAGVADLVRLAGAFPGTHFVLGHCGVSLIDTHALGLVADLPNILVETSGGYTHLVRLAVSRLGADRLLFAAEHPLQPPAVELAKFRALNLDPETWRRIAWENAHRILGEEIP